MYRKCILTSLFNKKKKTYHDVVILTSFLALIMSRGDVLSNEIKEIYVKINE